MKFIKFRKLSLHLLLKLLLLLLYGRWCNRYCIVDIDIGLIDLVYTTRGWIRRQQSLQTLVLHYFTQKSFQWYNLTYMTSRHTIISVAIQFSIILPLWARKVTIKPLAAAVSQKHGRSVWSHWERLVPWPERYSISTTIIGFVSQQQQQCYILYHYLLRSISKFQSWNRFFTIYSIKQRESFNNSQ